MPKTPWFKSPPYSLRLERGIVGGFGLCRWVADGGQNLPVVELVDRFEGAGARMAVASRDGGRAKPIRLAGLARHSVRSAGRQGALKQ